ncbi:MAG TPA: hypothetical protein VFO10_27935 [Oligoflexus sp.]|uniref:hypothetical protein n=1 Tax=Oligoflexus sp. TaxID=1971216 RepID=UPI002D7F6FC0|nr:hypothetical protein [Oligoflexus sp.]HET9241128.1 hypothetical protein [Oligoflexus sp.]
MRYSCLLVFMLSFEAFAAPHPAEVPVVNPPILRSVDYRQDARFQVTAGLGSLIPYLGFSLNLGYFQEPDRLYTLSYTTGVDMKDFLLNLFLGHDDEVHARLLTAGFKQFFANSFYAEGSGFMRRLTQVATNELSYSSREGVADFTMDSLGVTLAFGNQWQWPTFTIGCDWVGMMVPLVHGSLRADEAPGVDPQLVAEEGDDFKTLVKESRLTLLRFYLGYTF